MDDPEVRADILMRIKKFETLIDELKNTEIECDRASLYEILARHTSYIRDKIWSALTDKLNSIRNEIAKIRNAKGKKYVSLEEHDTKIKILHAMSAEGEEIQNQMEEHNKKMGNLANNLKLINLLKGERIKPSTCGVHLIGLEFLKEFTRIVNALPIYAKRSSIMEVVDNNQFVVLKGETGSGKSTQLAQYVMERVSTKADMKVSFLLMGKAD